MSASRPATLLLAAVAATAVWSAPERPEAQRVRSEIADVLAQPRYAQSQPSWLREQLVAVVRWFREFFSGWWGDAAYQLRETWPGLYFAIVAVLCLLVVALLYHIVLVMLSALGRGGTVRQRAVASAAPDPEGMRREAARMASEGRYRDAIALLYLALLELLDRQGLARIDRSRTNWEYLQAVEAQSVRTGSASADRLVPAMRELAERLDGVLYGGLVAGPADYEACVAAMDGVQEAGRAQ